MRLRLSGRQLGTPPFSWSLGLVLGLSSSFAFAFAVIVPLGFLSLRFCLEACLAFFPTHSMTVPKQGDEPDEWRCKISMNLDISRWKKKVMIHIA